MKKFFLIMFLCFVLELFVIIKVGSVIGGFNTILLMFVLMVVGCVLIKLRFKKIMEIMQTQGVVDFKLILLPLAGFLFLFPGFISDILGLLLLLPPVQSKAEKVYRNSTHSSQFSWQSSSETGSFSKGRVIDATVIHDEDENSDDTKSSDKKNDNSFLQ